MKKTLTLLLVVAAIAAFAGSASAITCTLDQHPAATLLVPYFQVAENADGTLVTGDDAKDTIINIVNASSANTVAHIVVWNRVSEPVLDINIPFTGFDEYTFFMGDLLTGHLTGGGNTTVDEEVCAKGGSSSYVRFLPTRTPSSFDLDFAATAYSDPLFGLSFAKELAAELDGQDDCAAGGGDPDGSTLVGYVTIDMVNYCTLSNPAEAEYWDDDAAGWENNFFGDYIIVTGNGIPTYGNHTVALEADKSLNGTPIEQGPAIRTFYARYWESASLNENTGDSGDTNNGDENTYLCNVGLCGYTNSTYGDWREPLGTQWAVRYANTADLTTYLRVWRGSADGRKEICEQEEPIVIAVVYDEDEGRLDRGGCQVSPCPKQPFINFPWETQRCNVNDGVGTNGDCTEIVPVLQGGWLYVDVLNKADGATNLDQAWFAFDIQTNAPFINIGVEGTQLNPSSCNVPNDGNVQIVSPVAPALVGLGI